MRLNKLLKIEMRKIQRNMKESKYNSDDGLKKLEQTLKDKKYDFTTHKEDWDYIKDANKTGKVQAKKERVEVIKRIIKNLPKLKKEEKKEKTAEPSECDKNFVKNLKKLYENQDMKSKEGRDKVKELMKRDFLINDDVWKQIEGNIEKKIGDDTIKVKSATVTTAPAPVPAPATPKKSALFSSFK